MKKNMLYSFSRILALAVLLLVFAACANMGLTEPVLGTPHTPAYSLGSEYRYTALSQAEPRAEVRLEKYDDSSLLRELAALRADFRVLQEENQKVNLRMESVERELLAKDAQLKELQSLLSVLDGQVASADRQWSERMENLKRNMDAEREQRHLQMEKLSSNVAQELSRVQSKPEPGKSAKTGEKFIELVIQKGDTLSGIAANSGVSVQRLKEYNGLKNDQIRIGQVLKLPVK